METSGLPAGGGVAPPGLPVGCGGGYITGGGTTGGSGAIGATRGIVGSGGMGGTTGTCTAVDLQWVVAVAVAENSARGGRCWS